MDVQLVKPVSNESPMVARAIRGRRFRAFAIVSMTCLLVFCLIGAMSSDGYVTRARVRLGVGELPNRQQIDRLDDYIKMHWASVTNRHDLRQIAEEVGIENKPGQDIMETLRNTLYYTYNATNQGEHFVYFSLEGSGTEKEQQLLDRIVRAMAGKIAMAPVMDRIARNNSESHQQQLSTETSRFVGRQLELYQRLEWLTNQMDTDLKLIRTRLDGGADKSSKDNVARQEHEWSMLKKQIVALKANRDDLVSKFGLDSAEVARLSQLIEANEAKINDGNTQFANRSQFQQNQFVAASFSKTASSETEMPTAEEASQAFGSLDVGTLKRSLVELKRGLQDFHQQAAQRHQTVSANVSNFVPVFVQGIQQGRVEPVSGGLDSAWFLGALMLSIFMGTIVSWTYKPLSDDRGFTSVDQVAAQLQLPVYGSVEKFEDGADVDHQNPAANMIVKGCSFLLLAGLMVILTAIVFNPGLRAAFAENPLYGLSKLVWVFQSH